MIDGMEARQGFFFEKRSKNLYSAVADLVCRRLEEVRCGPVQTHGKVIMLSAAQRCQRHELQPET